MTNKKQLITDKKIECYILKDNDIVEIKAGAESFNIKLKIKYIEESSRFDSLTNYLLKVQKALSDLKSKFDFSEDSEITVIVDEKDILKVVKPDGVIPLKPSKALKKSIDDINFKRTLGILLFEFSTFNKIDLIFKDFSLKEKEVNEMNNNFESKNEDINFEIDSQNDNFDLDMDISSFSDIIVSETDSFNYEDELFKDFDLNANDLFKETIDNNDFTLDFNEKDINDKSNNNSYEITKEDINTSSQALEVDTNLDFNISLDSESSLEIEDFEISTNSSFIDNSLIINDDITVSDDFNIEDDFKMEDDFKVEDDFISINSETENDNIPTYDSKEDVYIPTYESKEDVYIPTYESKDEDFNIPTYDSKEEFDVPVYESKEEDFLVIESSEDIIPDEPIIIDEKDIVYNDNTIESKEETTNIQAINNEIKETLVKTKVDTIVSDNIDYVIPKEKHNPENNSKKEIPKNNSSRHDSKTSIIKKDNIESKPIKQEIDNKEGIAMENNKVSNSYSSTDNKEFIKKEMIELRNILKNKSNSYKSKMSKLNAEFNEKHNALKDLNVRDEEEQFKIFKEFLACKSNILDLNDLSETCNSIIVDIESKISSL